MRNRFSSPFTYAEYEYQLTNENIIPILKCWNVDLENKKLIDIGCGFGGSSVAFAERGCNCVGIDINEDRIEYAIKFAKSRKVIVKFFKEDICDIKISKENRYDIAIFIDVIEHVQDPMSALTNIFRLLKEKGLLYVSFPPIYSPFGGHQHAPVSITRFMPYVHLLPDRIFFRMLPNDEIRRFVKTVKLNKISIAKFEKLVRVSRFKYLKENYI